MEIKFDSPFDFDYSFFYYDSFFFFQFFFEDWFNSHTMRLRVNKYIKLLFQFLIE